MERHIAAQLAAAEAVREWDRRKAAGGVTSVFYANALLEVAREEEEARRSIVQFVPSENRELRQKLTNLAAYLFATRGSLMVQEMQAVMRTTERISEAGA